MSRQSDTGTDLAQRSLYPVLALTMAAIAVAGFAPGYLGSDHSGPVGRSAAVHVHALVFTGWLLLFATQASLPMAGRRDLHMRLGKLAAWYGGLIVLTGLLVTFDRLHAWKTAGILEQQAVFFLLPLTDLVYFIGFFSAALYYRRKPLLHKRLMVLTGTLLVFPGAVRIDASMTPPNLPLLYLVWLSPILLAIVHDAVFQRRFFKVYAVGMVILATMPMRMMAFQTEAAQAFTLALAEMLPG